MRYYKIVITDKNGKIIQSSALSGTGAGDEATFTSYVNGKTLPGALNIELDVQLAELDAPINASIRIWGISREEISQSFSLVNKDIVVYAGMKKGLPLANPDQSQMPVVRGFISQAFGNWQGTTQTLDLVVIGDFGRSGDKRNFSFNWRANQPIADAIKTCMEAALPEVKVEVLVSPDLKYDYDQVGIYGTLPEFSQALIQITNTQQFVGIKTLNNLPYQGIHCYEDLSGQVATYVFTDNTRQRSGGGSLPAASGAVTSTKLGPRKISFNDIIGQPTWMNNNTISFKTVMRSDILVTDQIQFPELIQPLTQLTGGLQGPASTFDGDQLPADQISRNKSAFKGVFQVQTMQHYGNFRQADGDSWATSFTAFFNADHDANKEFKVSEQDGLVTNQTPPNKPRLEDAVPPPPTPPPPPFSLEAAVPPVPEPLPPPVFPGPSAFVQRTPIRRF